MKNTDVDNVAIFWDYENCPTPTGTSGYTIVNNIRSVAQRFGSVKLFKAYLEVTEQVTVLRSELQSSGVSLTDCPHNGRKDAADKMIIVDMLAYAIDNLAPSTIILISGDRDFAYALSTLRLRRYRIVLITLSNAHPSLRVQASLCFDWASDVLELVDPTGGDVLCGKAHNISRYTLQASYDEKFASDIESMNYFQDAARHQEISQTPLNHDARRDLHPPKTQTISSSESSDQVDDGGDSAHSDISPRPNVTDPLSGFIPLSDNATTSSAAQSSVKAAKPFQPRSCPRVPDKFKILVRCLEAHRSHGRIRLLRSKIALEIACNGSTYREAGVSNFRRYIAMAAKAGIVEMGGSELMAWIALRGPWYNASLS